jgi:hypothetical protein
VAVATLATQSVQGGRFVALSMDIVGAAALTAARIKPVFSIEIEGNMDHHRTLLNNIFQNIQIVFYTCI